MEEIILTQTENADPESVEELSLEPWSGSVLTLANKKLLEKYENLDYLSFSGCGLESLDNFPNLPNLIKLDLNDNNIKSGLNHLADLTELMQLSLMKNKIESLSAFEPLAGSTLGFLEIEGCPVTKIADYRAKIFRIIPSLSTIDGFDKEGKEVVISDEDEDEENLDEEDSIEDDSDEDDLEEDIESVDSESESESDDDPKKRKRNPKASQEPSGKKRFK